MNTKPSPEYTVYLRPCRTCKRDTEHAAKWREVKAANRMERGRRYVALVCIECGSENGW